MGFNSLQEDDANRTKAMFREILDSIPTNGTAHSYQGRELFFEFLHYLKGWPVWNAFNGFTSFDASKETADVNINPGHRALWESKPHIRPMVKGFAPDLEIIEGWDLDQEVAGTSQDPQGSYISPLGPESICAKIFTVNFMFGPSTQDDGPNDSQAEIERRTGLGRNCQGVQCQFSNMIRYLNTTDLAPSIDGDQKVVSYFLSRPQPSGNLHPALWEYAKAGGTVAPLALSDDPEEIVAALTEVIKQILSISTTFTAAALPVNSFDRSQVLSDVFLALFQPTDHIANKYWWGNVKKLKLQGIDTIGEEVVLVDANNQPAIAPDGRIKFGALTFWTEQSGFDVQDPSRDPDENAEKGSDGRSVNRGGSGHKTPGFLGAGPGIANSPGPRRMFYDSGAGALSPLDATSLVASDLRDHIGAPDDDEALSVIQFMRGIAPGSGSDADPPVTLDWMFGSAMHSRPLPVNYGARNSHTKQNPLIYVAVGGNDGALRFIRNTDSGGNQLGREAWAFVPTEVMSNVRRTVREDGALLTGESTVYGFDGAPTLYVEGDVEGTIVSDSRAIIYAGLRRGGSAYYAIDVSDPENPELIWRIVGGENPSHPDFAELGLTFSQPRVGKVNFGGSNGIRPVVVFGGGYDRIYDQRSDIPTGVKGRGIYVVDGLTGELVKHITHPDMSDSIPSTVTVVDTVNDGLLDRMYVGDLGGRVWRVDMTPAGGPDDWRVSLLADLGRYAEYAPAGGAADRRFFHAPDVVLSKTQYQQLDGTMTTVEFDAVLIGSGDRENPLDDVAGPLLPQNWFFMIRDYNTAVLSESDDTAHNLGDFLDVTANTGTLVPQGGAGWALQLTVPGEKSLATPLTLAGIVYFTTYLPPGATASSVCGPAEGSGRLYTVSLQNANPPRNRDGIIVDTDELDPDLRFDTLKSGGIPAEVVLIPQVGKVMRPDFELLTPPFSTRWRTYWYVQEDPVQ